MKPFKNLTDLANHLWSMNNGRDAECGFDMSGSACCIGGWVQIANPEAREMFLEEAVQSLQPDLDLQECYSLCYPEHFLTAYDATPLQAARAVEILRDTGKADWPRAMREGAV